jgi:hypothetical protein
MFSVSPFRGNWKLVYIKGSKSLFCRLIDIEENTANVPILETHAVSK